MHADELALLERIAVFVSNKYGVPVKRLTGPGRAGPVSRARHAGMFLARDLTDLRLSEIAAFFGRSDHTTVIYAVEKVKKTGHEADQLVKECQWALELTEAST